MKAAGQPPFQSQLEALHQVVGVSGAASFTWYGWVVRELDAPFDEILEETERRRFLVESVQHHLYQRFYTTGLPVRQLRTTEAAGTAATFVDSLAAANSGLGYIDAPWDVVGEADGESLRLARNGVEVIAAKTDIERLPDGQVGLRMANGFARRSPGFYMARSNAPWDLDSKTIRLYWNLSSEGAAPFIDVTTRILNEHAIPFLAKTVDNPRRFYRRDSAVLYLAATQAVATPGVIRSVFEALRDYCGVGVPALTREVSEGVGFAEDPPNRESYGMHRCALLAEAIVGAHERSLEDFDEWYVHVDEVFASSDIDIRRPYLTIGSQVDTHPWDAVFEVGRPSSQRVRRQLQEGDYVDAAAAIGYQIASEAWWNDGACTWIGAEPEVAHFGTSDAPPGATTYVSLGGELYHGTVGIGVFLAELFCETGDSAHGEAAAGAARHALRTVDSLVETNAVGLYTGWTGVLAASAYIASLLGDTDLLDRTDSLLKAHLDSCTTQEFDLTGGAAGGILGLLILDELLERPVIESVNRLVDWMLEHAIHEGDVASWKSHAFPERLNLLGLSHGASGAGLAMAEAAHGTGRLEIRRAMVQAFNYERQYFDNARRNWPDFRDKLGSSKWQKEGYLNFMTSWCHGAPGIGLARLRSYDLTRDDTLLEDAELALDTTARILTNSFAAGNGNFSLCHGWCGNADVLLYGQETLGTDAYGDVIGEVAARAIDHLAAGRVPPLGVSSGYSPTLMLGLSGVGYYFLRMTGRVPAQTLPSPAALSRRVQSVRAAVGS